MTDKEFQRLTRAQLMDIIYQLQLQIDDLIKQKQELENALADKRIRLENAGNIAEAALEMNQCFRSAQNAATQYLEEIKAIRKSTGMTQKLFAGYLGVSVKTVEAWESGRNHPEGAACRLLSMTQKDPSFPQKSGIVSLSEEN